MIDLPLIMTALLFLGLGFIYGWGLLYFFRETFRWSLASVVGIAIVVSCTYVLVWEVRGISSPLQVVIDLAVVFLAALPGMAWVDYELHADRIKQTDELERRNLELAAAYEQKNQIKEQVKLILLEQKETKHMLSEILALLSLRQEAIEILESRRN